MDIDAIRHLYDEHMRRNTDFSGSKREVVPPVVRYVNQKMPRSVVRYTELTDVNADKTIQREKDFFSQLGHHFEWTIYNYDQPPDLRDRLAAHGFEIGEVEAILVLDITNVPEKLRRETNHDIRQITNPAHISPLLNAVQNPVFDHEANNWMNEHLTSALRDEPDMYQVFAAYVDGEPASAAWIDYITPGNLFAGLYGGATLEPHRGKGLYSALVAARAKEALKRGVRYLTVDASPMSRPILERIGFVKIALSWACEYTHEDQT